MYRKITEALPRHFVGTLWGLKIKNSTLVNAHLYPTRAEARANKSTNEIVIKFELYTEYVQ